MEEEKDDDYAEKKNQDYRVVIRYQESGIGTRGLEEDDDEEEEKRIKKDNTISKSNRGSQYADKEDKKQKEYKEGRKEGKEGRWRVHETQH